MKKITRFAAAMMIGLVVVTAAPLNLEARDIAGTGNVEISYDIGAAASRGGVAGFFDKVFSSFGALIEKVTSIFKGEPKREAAEKAAKGTGSVSADPPPIIEGAETQVVENAQKGLPSDAVLKPQAPMEIVPVEVKPDVAPAPPVGPMQDIKQQQVAAVPIARPVVAQQPTYSIKTSEAVPAKEAIKTVDRGDLFGINSIKVDKEEPEPVEVVTPEKPVISTGTVTAETDYVKPQVVERPTAPQISQQAVKPRATVDESNPVPAPVVSAVDRPALATGPVVISPLARPSEGAASATTATSSTRTTAATTAAAPAPSTDTRTAVVTSAPLERPASGTTVTTQSGTVQTVGGSRIGESNPQPAPVVACEGVRQVLPSDVVQKAKFNDNILIVRTADDKIYAVNICGGMKECAASAVAVAQPAATGRDVTAVATTLQSSTSSTAVASRAEATVTEPSTTAVRAATTSFATSATSVALPGLARSITGADSTTQMAEACGKAAEILTAVQQSVQNVEQFADRSVFSLGPVVSTRIAAIGKNELDVANILNDDGSASLYSTVLCDGADCTDDFTVSYPQLEDPNFKLTVAEDNKRKATIVRIGAVSAPTKLTVDVSATRRTETLEEQVDVVFLPEAPLTAAGPENIKPENVQIPGVAIGGSQTAADNPTVPLLPAQEADVGLEGGGGCSLIIR